MIILVVVGLAIFIIYVIISFIRSFFSMSWLALVILAVLFLMACCAVKMW